MRLQLPRIEPRLLLGVAALAASDRRFGVRVLFVAVLFVALDAAGLVSLVRAAGDSMIGVLDVDAAALLRGVGMIGLLVAGDALQDRFLPGVLVGVMAILAPLGIRRFEMIAVIEIFDDAPFAVLAPMRTLFRIAQSDDARRDGLFGR